MGFSLTQKKDYAKELYLNTKKIQQKEIAERVGVSVKTISRWLKLEDWARLKKSLLTTRSEQLGFLYNQLDCLNTEISRRVNKYADSKEASTIINLTVAIKNLETETSVSDIIQVARDFISFVSEGDYEQSKQITTLFDAFVNYKMK